MIFITNRHHATLEVVGDNLDKVFLSVVVEPIGNRDAHALDRIGLRALLPNLFSIKAQTRGESRGFVERESLDYFFAFLDVEVPIKVQQQFPQQFAWIPSRTAEIAKWNLSFRRTSMRTTIDSVTVVPTESIQNHSMDPDQKLELIDALWPLLEIRYLLPQTLDDTCYVSDHRITLNQTLVLPSPILFVGLNPHPERILHKLSFSHSLWHEILAHFRDVGVLKLLTDDLGVYF